MDLSEQFNEAKRNFKCEHNLLDNLSITYNIDISTCVLFNKFQILFYERLNFENISKIFDPEFQVSQILITKNYLICLDTSGNIHTISLKFKHNAQKRIKSSFQSREMGILCVNNYSIDSIFSLKRECETYYLCIYNTSRELHLMKKISILLEDQEQFPSHILQNNCLLETSSVPAHCMENMKETYNVKNLVANGYKIITLTLDKFTVYACLLSNRVTEEEVTMKHICTCPSEICDIRIIKTESLDILIGLNSGTIIKINLVFMENLNVIHLNTALSKFIPYKNNVIYTDGISLWKADISSPEKVKFSQLFLRQIKDLLLYNEQVICTTFANMIYVFNINDESVYLKELAMEYYPVDKILNNMECLNKIIEEVEKSNKLAKEIDLQKKYLTALALSNRKDIMEKVVYTNVLIYESYEDLIREGETVFLTETLESYFESEAILFLVKISTSDLQNKFSSVLSSALGELNVHITLSNKEISKTTSVKVNETLKKLNIFIPFNGSFRNTKVQIELILNLPGTHDETQKLWTILYEKEHIVGLEQFIKTNVVTPQQIFINNIAGTTESTLLKMASKLHGNLYKISDTKKCSSKKLSFYIKLPGNYKDIFLEESNYKQYFCKRKAEYLQNLLKSEEFLNSKNKLCFEVEKNKVEIEIFNEFSIKVLKISCDDMEIGFGIRCFFSNLIYNGNRLINQETVKYSYYTAVENLEKEMKSLSENGMDQEKFEALADQFQKNVLGALPL